VTSLLKPDPNQLRFFNGFIVYGSVEQELTAHTERLADVLDLQGIGYLKIDVQGAEMMILAWFSVDRCVAAPDRRIFHPSVGGSVDIRGH
jgi:hypothetical protein